MISNQLSALSVKEYLGHVTESPALDGVGSAEYHSGNTYSGEFKSGLLHGQGRYEWKDGVVYTGQFHENKISGMGTYEWTDGAVYSGALVDGLRSGNGKFTLKKSDNEYQGAWKQGRPCGFVIRAYSGDVFLLEQWVVYRWLARWKAARQRCHEVFFGKHL